MVDHEATLGLSDVKDGLAVAGDHSGVERASGKRGGGGGRVVHSPIIPEAAQHDAISRGEYRHGTWMAGRCRIDNLFCDRMDLMEGYYTELMLVPASGIDVDRLKDVIGNLKVEDVSDRAFLYALEPLVDFDVDEDPTDTLGAAKAHLRLAVDMLGELKPVELHGAPGSDPIHVLVGEGNLDLDDVTPADAVALVRSCPKLSAALYEAAPAVTLR